MEKIYTYDDLPKKNNIEVQHQLTDEIILEYLNNIVKNSNLLVSIEYKEEAKADELTAVNITFNLLKKQEKNNA